MKIRLIYMTVPLLVLLVSCRPASAAPAHEPVVTVLPSGLTVIVQESHETDLVAVDIFVRAGSVTETEADNGICHFIEHMIFKATRKYGPGQIDRDIEGLGAELNGGTARDYVHFYTTLASTYLPVALDVLGDAMANAQFRSEDIERERRVVLDELAKEESDPTRSALSAFSRTVYGSHPYALPPSGSRKAVSALTRDDLLAHYQKYFTAGNTCVVVVGDVDPSTALKEVRQAFAGLTPSSRPEARPAPAPAAQAQTPVVQRVNANGRTYVAFGYRAPAASNLTEACAFDVMLALLGDGNQGRLAEALAARGIRFKSIRTDYTSQWQPSIISILVTVEPVDAERTAAVLFSEMKRLTSEAVSDKELLKAKSIVIGGDLYDQETFAGRARLLGLYQSVASYEYLWRYAETVNSLTQNDIGAAAQTYFGDNNYYLVIGAPERPVAQ